eukprot:350784-Chlamydomonas_euryale.AAC.1
MGPKNTYTRPPRPAVSPQALSGMVARHTHTRRADVLHATQAVEDLVEVWSVSRILCPAVRDELGHLGLEVGRQHWPPLQVSDFADDL